MSPKLLAALVFTAALVHHTSASPALASNFIEQENSCREVCGLCNCDGFYCIDECICECSIKDEENLQCITDMKKECDRNGLEYELLMQESTKERFLRQINTNSLPFANFANNFVILKHKRDSEATAAPAPAVPPASTTAEPVVGAAAPSSKIVVQPGYEKPEPPADSQKEDENEQDDSVVGSVRNRPALGFPLNLKAAALDGKLAFAGLSNLSPKLLFSLRDSVTAPPRWTTTTTTTTRRPILSAFPSLSFPSFDSILSKPAPATAKEESDDEE